MGGGEVTVTHLWNGVWGRLGRVDLWLKRWGDTDWWRVEATRGGAEGRFWASPDLNEADARAQFERLRDHHWPDQTWTDLTKRDGVSPSG